METLRIAEYMKCADREKRQQFAVAIGAATVLKGVHTSCILTLPSGGAQQLRTDVCNSNIQVCLLSEYGEREVVLVYRPDCLRRCLKTPQVRAFLRTYGYERTSLEEALQKLGNRLSAYYTRKTGFPHELGIFLGYPWKDVVAYIRNDGRNCHYVGYWKVYSNVEEAKEMFARFDRAKSQVITEFMLGKEIREIAC